MPAYDTVFRGALVYDGTGAPPSRGDVAIASDLIAASTAEGGIAPGAGDVEVDARGLALAPGFIDAHTHDDRILIDSPDMLPKISQGVTTVVVGNCGISLAPATFAEDPPPPMNLLGGTRAYEFPSFASYAARLQTTSARCQCRGAGRSFRAAPRRHVRRETPG